MYDENSFLSSFVAEIYESPSGRSMPFRLCLPDGKPGERYPLVVHLHGSTGKGTDNWRHITGDTEAATTRIRSNYVCVHPDNQRRFPCYVIAPQTDDHWIPPNPLENPEIQTVGIQLVLELIPVLLERFEIDPNRCYVMGHSTGAHAVWDLITRAPHLFAAAIPMGGWGNPAWASRVVGLSIWFFYVDGDPLLSVEFARDMIAAIRKAGGNPRYTEYEGTSHGDLLRAYKEPEFLPWLFAQRRPIAPDLQA